MSSRPVDLNLLFVISALQTNSITRQQLLAGFDTWVRDQSRDLSQILVEAGALTREEHDELTRLVAEFLEKHEADDEPSLSAASMATLHRPGLQRPADADLSTYLGRAGDTATDDLALPTKLDKPQTLAGRFRILRPHAKGGLGQVSVALDLELNREVALKEILIQHSHDATARERFVLEAEITGGLEHPGIVPVYALGKSADGRPFYAMQFIKGNSLRQAIEQFHSADNPNRKDPGARQLEIRQLLGRFIDVCNAMEYAHSRGVLHRDLKPGNIMIGKYGETLVVDWGLAKVMGRREIGPGAASLHPTSVLGSSTQTQAGSAVGTASYMSPEQAAGKLDNLGPATDVYSLGATLYHLLCGERPFKKEDLASILKKVQIGDFDRPRMLLPEIPRAMEAICLKAMALKPGDRYESAAALAEAIEYWLAEASEDAARMRRLLYAAHLALAQSAWETDQISSVLERLKVHLPEEDKDDLRGFEWFYWDRMCHGDLLTIQVGSAICAAFSTDGTRIISASTDGTVRIWDSDSGEEKSVHHGVPGQIGAVAFSDEGKHLAASSWNGLTLTLKVTEWDSQTGVETFSFQGKGDLITHLACSRDGKQLATMNGAGVGTVWAATRGNEALTIKERLASLFKKKVDNDTEAAGRLVLAGHGFGVRAMAFSADGNRLAVADENGIVLVWNTSNGRQILSLKGHGGNVTSVAFSRDGKRLATASADRTVKVWDAVNGLESVTLRGHLKSVSIVTFGPDGLWLASGDEVGTVKLWNSITGQEVRTLKGQTGNVTSVAFSEDGRRLLSVSTDETLKVWDLGSNPVTISFKDEASRRVLPLIKDVQGIPHWMLDLGFNGVDCVAFSPDGLQLASVGGDDTVKVSDATSSQELFKLKGQLCVAYSPDGQRLAAASADQTVTIWTAATGQEFLKLKGHAANVTSVVFSPCCQYLISASLDQTIKLWAATTGEPLLTLRGYSAILKVACSPNGKRLASANINGSVNVWDAEIGRVILTLRGHTGTVQSVAFSPDGKRLASASNDHTVKLWDAISGRELLTLKGHSSTVNCVAISPDGRRLASASWDETVKLWDMTTGQELLTLKGHTSMVNHVAISPDGKRLASASNDGTVKVWDARPWSSSFCP